MKNTCRAGVPIEADKPCPRCGANRGGSCAIGDMQAEAELRAEIGRLKAELEERSGQRNLLNGMWRAAEAEAGAMRDALGKVHGWIVSAAIASPEDMMQNADAIEALCAKALSPTIGAEVMRVVRAARTWKEKRIAHNQIVWGDTARSKAAAADREAQEELWEALAALGGTHER